MECPTVKCEICGKECDGAGVGVHRELTSHNSWTIILPDISMRRLDTMANCPNCGRPMFKLYDIHTQTTKNFCAPCKVELEEEPEPLDDEEKEDEN